MEKREAEERQKAEEARKQREEAQAMELKRKEAEEARKKRVAEEAERHGRKGQWLHVTCARRRGAFANPRPWNPRLAPVRPVGRHAGGAAGMRQSRKREGKSGCGQKDATSPQQGEARKRREKGKRTAEEDGDDDIEVDEETAAGSSRKQDFQDTTGAILRLGDVGEGTREELAGLTDGNKEDEEVTDRNVRRIGERLRERVQAGRGVRRRIESIYRDHEERGDMKKPASSVHKWCHLQVIHVSPINLANCATDGRTSESALPDDSKNTTDKPFGTRQTSQGYSNMKHAPLIYDCHCDDASQSASVTTPHEPTGNWLEMV
ncbi:hypothetical protein BU15DRAFT_64370 [Melanogaster broomeanus]|nr:hypothetical protein BU15DRAFT_64370 [Melanogaster broomeanus]